MSRKARQKTDRRSAALLNDRMRTLERQKMSESEMRKGMGREWRFKKPATLLFRGGVNTNHPQNIVMGAYLSGHRVHSDVTFGERLSTNA